MLMIEIFIYINSNGKTLQSKEIQASSQDPEAAESPVCTGRKQSNECWAQLTSPFCPAQTKPVQWLSTP